MSTLQLFTAPGGDQIRTVVVGGEPWFIARDACDSLGISKHRDAVAQLRDDERASTVVDTPGGPQMMTIVSESGLYALMFLSRSAKVQPFRRWVTNEVLPSIRKTGGYQLAQLTDLEKARLYVAALERVEVVEHRNAELEPKAAQADHFRKADGLQAVADFANDLALWARETHGIKQVLHVDVRDFLGEIGLIIRGNTVRNNHATADALKRGLMRAKHGTYETNTRGRQEAVSARLTPKGWGYAWDKATTRLAEHGALKVTTVERKAA